MNGTSDFMSGFMTGQNSDRNNGYGWGAEGSWIWIILIFALFGWGGNGWGNNRTDEQVDVDTRFIERDIFNTNQNVSNTACQTQRDVLENRYTTQLGLQQLGAQAQNCCCETQKEILQNRYDNALQTNTLQNQASTNALNAQMQLSDCCCKLEAQGLANTQKILDKLCENEINQLRTDLQSAQLQISQLSQTSNIVNTLLPRAVPAYPSVSPYMSAFGFGFNGFNGFNNGCGCNSGCGCNI